MDLRTNNVESQEKKRDSLATVSPQKKKRSPEQIDADCVSAEELNPKRLSWIWL